MPRVAERQGAAADWRGLAAVSGRALACAPSPRWPPAAPSDAGPHTTAVEPALVTGDEHRSLSRTDGNRNGNALNTQHKAEVVDTQRKARGRASCCTAEAQRKAAQGRAVTEEEGVRDNIWVDWWSGPGWPVSSVAHAQRVRAAPRRASHSLFAPPSAAESSALSRPHTGCCAEPAASLPHPMPAWRNPVSVCLFSVSLRVFVFVYVCECVCPSV